MATQLYTLPGFHGSGHNHWQSLWEKENKRIIRIEQNNWDRPNIDEWAQKVEEYLRYASKETIVIAHSLGCITLAYWAQYSKIQIAGALLVAPPNVESELLVPYLQGYEKFKPTLLPFNSIVLSSDNDPYNTKAKTKHLAEVWGSQFVDLGSKGHLNADSNLGNWSEGLSYLNKLVSNKKKPTSPLIESVGSRLYV